MTLVAAGAAAAAVDGAFDAGRTAIALIGLVGLEILAALVFVALAYLLPGDRY